MQKLDLTPKQLRFIKFGLLGCVTTCFSIFLFFIFVKALEIKLVIAYIPVFIISVIFSYILNCYFNYKHRPTLHGLFGFYKSYFASATIGYILIWIIKYFFPLWDEFLVAIFIMGVRFLITFSLIEKFLFKKTKG